MGLSKWGTSRLSPVFPVPFLPSVPDFLPISLPLVSLPHLGGAVHVPVPDFPPISRFPSEVAFTGLTLTRPAATVAWCICLSLLTVPAFTGDRVQFLPKRSEPSWPSNGCPQTRASASRPSSVSTGPRKLSSTNRGRCPTSKGRTDKLNVHHSHSDAMTSRSVHHGISTEAAAETASCTRQ